MTGFQALSEAPVSAQARGLPFGAFISASATLSATASVFHTGAAALVAVAAISAKISIFVFATASFTAQASLAATPNFIIYAATKEFITRSTDQVANQAFYGTLEKTIQFDTSIITGTGFGGVTITWGELTLINASKDYDYLIRDFSNDGRRVLIRVGRDQRDPQYDGFYTIFDGTASGNQVQQDVLRVFIRDNTYKLEVPAQPNVYDSSVDANLIGTRIPKCWGFCQNITPVLISAASLLFQVHDGPVNAITAVKSRGAQVTFYQDFATKAALLGASIPSGHYATCIAAGLFRINFRLEGAITADVQGDASGGVYAKTTADIIQRVCLASPAISAASYDAASFSTVNQRQPAPACYFLEPSSTAMIADVIDDLASGIGGWAGFRRDGLLEIGIVTAPAGIPSAIYSEVDIENIDRNQLPSGIDPPPYRFRVASGRNFTVMNQTDLAGSLLGTAAVQFLTNPYTLASSSSADQSAISTNHPTAQDPSPVLSWFVNGSDATTEAQRRLDLFSKNAYSLYKITLLGRQFIHKIGDVILVTYSRWDLTKGRLLTLVSVSEKTETGETVVVGFG